MLFFALWSASFLSIREYGSKAEEPHPYPEGSSWLPPSSGMEKQRGGAARRGEAGVPRGGSDSP